MGGMFCLGIRADMGDGPKEISLAMPTTAFADTLTSPDLFKSKKMLKYIFSTKWYNEKNKGKDTSIFELPEVRAYGYGTVLVDFVEKKVISRQAYSKPMEILLTASSPRINRNAVERFVEVRDFVAVIQELHDSKGWRNVSKPRKKRIIDEAKDIVDSDDYDRSFSEFSGVIHAVLNYGMHLNHKATPAAQCFNDITSFMKSNSWKKAAKADLNEE